METRKWAEAQVCARALVIARRGRFRREQDRRVGSPAAVEAGVRGHQAFLRSAPTLRVAHSGNTKTTLDLKSGKATR